MFQLICDGKPCKPHGTIKVSKPIYHLGPVTDIDGKRWDIYGLIGNMVQACPMSDLHPYYTDTSNNNYGIVHQRWYPYNVEVVTI